MTYFPSELWKLLSCCVKISLHYIYVCSCLTLFDLYSIQRRIAGARNQLKNKWVIRNQVNTQNENLKIKILWFMQALVEVAMKILKKQIRKMTAVQKISERMEFIRL